MMSVVCYLTFILGAFLFLCDHGIAQSPLSILPVPPPFPDRGPCSDRPAVVGPCRARLRRYTYRNGRCEEFYYGGCFGNRNNFRSRRECQRQCGGGGGGGGGDICRLPHAQPGPCLAYMPRYTFNSNTGRCEEFIYGGCQGNANRFETLQECRRRCGGGGPPRDRCFERPKVQGPCEAAIPSFSYNPRTRRCEEFTYGGCGGTRNRFSTLRECRDRCQRGGGGGGGVDICELPPRASGLCLAYIPSYSYDSARGECVRFIYGGCGGNENRFGSLQECQRRCGGGGGGGGGDACRERHAVTGPCNRYRQMFTYNRDTRRCERFIYGGCLGTNNRFPSRRECERRCGDGGDGGGGRPRRCLLPRETGPCRAAFPRYYFNRESGRCERFIYGGCQGNQNNFRSANECRRVCRRRRG